MSNGRVHRRAGVQVCLAAVVVVAVSAGAFGQSPDPDLLVAVSAWSNGGFESGLDGWELKKGWKPMSDQLRARAVSIPSGAEALEGNRYLRIENPDGDRFFALVRDVKWKPNTAYTLSWWMRGSAKEVKNERGNVRLRISGYGGPEYPGQFPYVLNEWTYFQLPLYSSSSSGGSVQLWVWPEGTCEMDAVTLRPAFWQPQASHALPGEVLALELRVPDGRRGGRAETSFQLTAPDGSTVEEGTRRGRLPLTHTIRMTPPSAGYYQLVSETRLSGADDKAGAMVDRVGVAVISPVDGIEAVRRQWE